jgi:hypothetical protein
MRHVHVAVSKILGRACRQRRILQWCSKPLHHLYHIHCGRHLLYYDFLYRRRGTYSHVLLCDVRDVVFQSDPFRYCTGKALYLVLDPSVRLGDEPVNVGWITAVYSDRYERQRRGERIACAGTTLGDAASIVTYLQEMSVALIRALPEVVGLQGVDQAVHNFLLWEGVFPNATICENGQHAVMTLKNASIDASSLDGHGHLRNLDGSPAPVLHQYDCQPLLRMKWSSLHQS